MFFYLKAAHFTGVEDRRPEYSRKVRFCVDNSFCRATAAYMAATCCRATCGVWLAETAGVTIGSVVVVDRQTLNKTYTASQKICLLMFGYNFGKCGPIFIIL